MSKSLGNFTTLADALDAYGPARVPPRGAAVALPPADGPRADRARGGGEGRRAVRGARRARRGRGRRRRRAARRSTPTIVEQFRDAMDDDFNTPGALAAIFEAVREANRAIDAGELDARGVAGRDGAGAHRRARPRPSATRAGDDDDEIDALVRERDEARAARDFAAADELRDELAALRHQARGHSRRHDLAPMSGRATGAARAATRRRQPDAKRRAA